MGTKQKKNEWNLEQIKIKKKIKKKNEWQYKLEELEANSLYYIRMRVHSTENGMSEWSETLKPITLDLEFKWDQSLKYKASPKFERVNRVKLSNSNACLVPISKQISNPSYIGFVNAKDVNSNGLNVNFNDGTQKNHQSIGVYPSNTAITIFNATNKGSMSPTSIYATSAIRAGDRLIFKANFKKKTVEIQHNELNLGVVFRNIDKCIIPAVSNNTSVGEYTIRLLS